MKNQKKKKTKEPTIKDWKWSPDEAHLILRKNQLDLKWGRIHVEIPFLGEVK